MRKYIHRFIAWYLRSSCGGAFINQGRYVVIMNELEYHYFQSIVSGETAETLKAKTALLNRYSALTSDNPPVRMNDRFG